MLKRSWWAFPLALVLFGLVVTGCGPRAARQETLNQLDECKKALSAMEQKKADLEKQIKDLKAEIERKQGKLSELQAERDSLRQWLDLLEAGY